MKRDEGSAYILTLLILVVLTLLGLSLALVTSTEMQVGANQRLIERTFYAADAGIGLATARMLVNSDFREVTLPLNVPPDAPASIVENQVTVGPLVEVAAAPCHLCDIAGSRGQPFQRILVAIPVFGERKATGGTAVVARQQLVAALDVQPYQAVLDPRPKDTSKIEF